MIDRKTALATAALIALMLAASVGRIIMLDDWTTATGKVHRSSPRRGSRPRRRHRSTASARTSTGTSFGSAVPSLTDTKSDGWPLLASAGSAFSSYQN